jgi:outer membrane protein assembly factor BamB
VKLKIFALLLILPFYLPAQSETGPSHNREPGRINSEPIWRQALGGEITGLPTVQVQSVVMPLDGGNIKAFSSSGKPLWNYSARGRISPFVTRSREGTSYISRTNGIFIAVNRAGRELWRKNHGEALSGLVSIGWDGRLFVPLGKKIICYTAAGTLLWSRELAEKISVSPRLDQSGGIIFTIESREMLRIDPFGKIQSRKLAAPAHALVSLDGGCYMVLYKNGSAEFLDFSESEGRPAPPLPSPPLAAAGRGNRAAICMADGRTLLVSGEDGKVIWTGESHISIRAKSGGGADLDAAMLFDERGVYVLSKSGATGFTEDGRRLWFTMLENAVAIPAFGDDGVLYSGGRDWILYAFRLEERVKREKFSLYGPDPLGSYGLGSPPPSPWADFYFRFDERELRAQFNLINAAIKKGEIGETETSWIAYLMETASGGYNKSAPVLAPILYRIKALELLGQIGSMELIPYLTEIFSKDKESFVRAAAAAAIGNIGMDPDGIALEAFKWVISPAAPGDVQLVSAVAAATGALCRFSGPPLSDMGVKVLTLINTSSQPKAAQQRAQRELASLRL